MKDGTEWFRTVFFVYLPIMRRRQFLKYAGAAGLAAALDPGQAFARDAKDSSLSLSKQRIRLEEGWDVIVVGGGPSGCTAAAAAAREGARTLLIESTGALGGMGTSGLLNAWCPFTDGKEIIYKGLAERIFLESLKGVPHTKTYNWTPINGEYLKVVYDDVVTAFGVKVLFFTSMAAVEMKKDGTVDCIIVANKAGLTAYRASVFVDCTGDGDLAARAGAGFEMGDADGAVQAGSLCYMVANVDFDKYTTVGGWRKDAPIYKMVNNPDYPLIHDTHFNDKTIARGIISLNAGHIEVDSTDPDSLTRAMMLGRKIAADHHRGMKEFDPEAFSSSFLAQTAALMGIRESRRIRCDYTFTVDDWLARREFEDNIGRNCYYIDVHKEGGKSYPRYKKGESHGIPYRCLTPVGLKNVLVAGRCISTDQAALGSLRVMPPAMVTGEAAGLAAALSARQARPDVHSVDIAQLRRRLVEEGQRID